MRPIALLPFMLAATVGLSAQGLQDRAALAPAKAPNVFAEYQRLRNIQLSDIAIAVNHLVLEKDRGTFTFKTGTLRFLEPVNRKVTGAVFSGVGEFRLQVSDPNERRLLRVLTDSDELVETFGSAIHR